MAIFDGLLGTSFDDPRTMGALALASGLLSAPRASQGLASGLLGYQQAIAQGKKAKSEEEERTLRRQAQELQLQQAQMTAEQARQAMARQQAIEQAYRGALVSPAQQALAQGGGPTQANATAMQGMTPQIDQSALLRGLTQADPMAAYQMLQPKPADYKVVGDALVQVGPSGVMEAYRAPAKPEATPSAIREFLFAQQNPEFAAYQERLKKAGANNTSLSVNTAKPLLNTVAEGLGKQIDASLENARAAVPAIQTAQSLKSAVDSGKVVSGPGASFRVTGLQIGQMLGIGGNSGAEVLSNTRQAIQSMAQAELNAAAQMKGQGQITESERDIIRRAASGRIDDLTGPEIKQLADVMEKTARFKIKQHQQNVGRLKNMPGAEPLVPFYTIDEPPAYSTPSAPRVRRYNPVTGKIEEY